MNNRIPQVHSWTETVAPCRCHSNMPHQPQLPKKKGVEPRIQGNEEVATEPSSRPGERKGSKSSGRGAISHYIKLPVHIVQVLLTYS